MRKIYGRRTIFSGLEGRFSPEVLGVAGPNGAGKSTLLKILARLVRPTSGRIEWSLDSTSLDGDAFRHRMSFCAPYIELYPDLTCGENLSLIASLRGAGQPDTGAVMDRAGLSDAEHQPYGRLSSGQKQRMRLTAGTFFDPGLLFLDEPGTNLDQHGSGLVRDLLASRRGRGWMTVLASNDQQELALCDEVIRLGSGPIHPHNLQSDP